MLQKQEIVNIIIKKIIISKSVWYVYIDSRTYVRVSYIVKIWNHHNFLLYLFFDFYATILAVHFVEFNVA